MASQRRRSRPEVRRDSAGNEYAIARAEIVGDVPDLDGSYFNFARVGQSTEELVIDFAVLVSSGDLPNMEDWTSKGVLPAFPRLRVRIPFAVAEGLANALDIQLKKKQTGEIFRPVDTDEVPAKGGVNDA